MSGRYMLDWDTVVEEARSQDTDIRSQELVDCCLELGLRDQNVKWKRVVIGHVNITARETDYNVRKIRQFEMDTLCAS